VAALIERARSIVITIGLGRTLPLPLSGEIVEVGGGISLQGDSAIKLFSFSHRKSSEVRPVDAKRITNTIERSAKSQPASEAVERFSDLSAMANWP
jgi:hypothetical protein